MSGITDSYLRFILFKFFRFISVLWVLRYSNTTYDLLGRYRDVECVVNQRQEQIHVI